MNYGEVQEYNRLHRVVGVIEQGGQLIEVHEDNWRLDKPPKQGMVVELGHEEIDGSVVYSAVRLVDKPQYCGWEEPDRFWFFTQDGGLPEDFDVVFNTNVTIEVVPGGWTTGSTDDEVRLGLRNKAERLYKANALINCTSRRVECRDGNFVYWANAIAGTPALIARRYPVATAEAEEVSRQGWLGLRNETEKAANWMVQTGDRRAKFGTYFFAAFVVAILGFGIWYSM